jgi:predicted metal-dependent RNase
VSGLSAHADRSELLRWIRSQPKPPGRIFVTHGEPETSRAFGSLLSKELSVDVVEPELGDRFDLEP